MPLWVGILWKASGLGASEQTKVRANYVAMLPCHNLLDLEEQRGSQRFFKFIIRREWENPQTTETFMGRQKKTTQGVEH